jgi:hypothetical protein
MSASKGVGNGEIRLAYHGFAWVDQFGLTGINVVALAALVLATSVAWRRRLRMLAIGSRALRHASARTVDRHRARRTCTRIRRWRASRTRCALS